MSNEEKVFEILAWFGLAWLVPHICGDATCIFTMHATLYSTEFTFPFVWYSNTNVTPPPPPWESQFSLFVLAPVCLFSSFISHRIYTRTHHNIFSTVASNSIQLWMKMNRFWNGIHRKCVEARQMTARENRWDRFEKKKKSVRKVWRKKRVWWYSTVAICVSCMWMTSRCFLRIELPSTT